MDNSSWTAPPGAAQPMGIQSTAGAVPIMNDKGKSITTTFTMKSFAVISCIHVVLFPNLFILIGANHPKYLGSV